MMHVSVLNTFKFQEILDPKIADDHRDGGSKGALPSIRFKVKCEKD